MTGAEHYAEAELLLTALASTPDGTETASYLDRAVATAQVHATLALAAASALPTVTHFMGDDREVTAWGRAIGVTGAPVPERPGAAF